jgi:hypothetical protein
LAEKTIFWLLMGSFNRLGGWLELPVVLAMKEAATMVKRGQVLISRLE